MVSVIGLDKVKKAVEYVSQIGTLSENTSFYTVIKDDISFCWKEWNIIVLDVLFVVNLRKDLEIGVNFGYDYADSPHQIYVYKTGMPKSSVYLHLHSLPIKGILNPVSLEFLNVYREMSMSIEDSTIPASISRKILGYVHSYINNFKNCYRSVEPKSVSSVVLLDVLRSDDSHLPERSWVIRLSPEDKKAVIVKASSPSQAYSKAIIEKDLPRIELTSEEFKRGENMNTMDIQFNVLKILSKQFPIYTI